MSGPQEDPATVEAVIVPAWQRPTVRVSAVDLAHQLLGSFFVAGLSISQNFHNPRRQRQ
jgi:hypothetical protein